MAWDYGYVAYNNFLRDGMTFFKFGRGIIAQISDEQAPQFYKLDGSRNPTGNLNMSSYDITFTTGMIRHADLSFRERLCPRCAKPFVIGERISLVVTWIYKGKDTKKKHIMVRPVHVNCELAGKSLDEMTKDELLDYSALLGLKAHYKMTKKKIKKILEKARKWLSA